MVKLCYSVPALNDLKAIHAFIAKDSPANAKRFIKQMKERIQVLKRQPGFGYPAFPEKFNNLRQVHYKSYRIIYLFENETVTIITVHHQSRLPDNITSLKEFEI